MAQHTRISRPGTVYPHFLYGLCTSLRSSSSWRCEIPQDNGLLVLPLPGDSGLRITSAISTVIIVIVTGFVPPRLTLEVDRGSLHADGVIGGLIVQNVRGLNHLQHPYLTHHGLRVDLAHVVTGVISDIKIDENEKGNIRADL